MNRPDVVGLVLGLLFTVLAAASLYVAFGGPVQGPWLKAAAPLALIAIGGVGLALSRGGHH